MDFKNDVVYMSEHTGCWGKCLNPQYLALVFFLSNCLEVFPFPTFFSRLIPWVMILRKGVLQASEEITVLEVWNRIYYL